MRMGKHRSRPTLTARLGPVPRRRSIPRRCAHACLCAPALPPRRARVHEYSEQGGWQRSAGSGEARLSSSTTAVRVYRRHISLVTAGCRWSGLLFRLQIDIDDEEEDQDNVPVRAAQRATYNRDALDNVPGARGVHRETLAPS